MLMMLNPNQCSSVALVSGLSLRKGFGNDSSKRQIQKGWSSISFHLPGDHAGRNLIFLVGILQQCLPWPRLAFNTFKINACVVFNTLSVKRSHLFPLRTKTDRLRNASEHHSWGVLNQQMLPSLTWMSSLVSVYLIRSAEDLKTIRTLF